MWFLNFFHIPIYVRTNNCWEVLGTNTNNYNTCSLPHSWDDSILTWLTSREVDVVPDQLFSKVVSKYQRNVKISQLMSLKYQTNIKQMNVIPSQLYLKNVYRIANKYQRWSSKITNKSNKWMWFLISLFSKMVIKYQTLANSNCQDMVVKLTDRKKKHVCQELVDK